MKGNTEKKNQFVDTDKSEKSAIKYILHKWIFLIKFDNYITINEQGSYLVWHMIYIAKQ